MHTLALLLVSFSCVLGNRPVPREVTIDAAFRYKGNLILISGDEYMTISSEGFERHVRLRSGDSDVPTAEKIQAAVAWPFKPAVFLFGKKKSYKNDYNKNTSKVRGYGKSRAFLKKGGPDAAATKSLWFYVFKGCQHVTQARTMTHLGTPRANKDLGLPCDIDAAWTDVNTRGMTVLKGDQIWVWRHGEVEGPMPFDEVYHIWSWTLKPLEDDRFVL